MLTFKGTTFCFIGALALYAISGYFFALPVYGFAVLLVCYLLVLFLGSFRVGSGFYMKVVCSGPQDQKRIAITFDDGPDKELTPRILEILRLHRVKATFFCIGKKVERYPELSRQMIEEGHAIENHSYDHPVATFWAALPQQIRNQIRRAQRAIHKVTDVPPLYFRSPVGMTNPFVHPEVMRDGLRLVGWSCAGFDGVCRSSRQVMRCLLPGIKPGAKN